MPSTRTDKEGNLHSRIMDMFPQGTTVSTSRNDVHWVATEFGAVNLRNRSISWRVENMINIAHPDFREELTFKAKQHGWL